MSLHPIDDGDRSINYTPVNVWSSHTTNETAPTWYGHTWHSAKGNQDFQAKISFTGTNVSVYGSGLNTHGRYFCQLDSTYPWFWASSNTNSASVTKNVSLCTVTGISNSPHVLTVGSIGSDNFAGTLVIDWYLIDDSTPEGTQPVFSSDFARVEPPNNFANTTAAVPSGANLPSSTGALSTPSAGNSADNDGSSSSGSGSGSTGVGLGVGLGVGIPLLAAVVFGFFFLRRRRTGSWSGTSTAKSTTDDEKTVIGSEGQFKSPMSPFSAADSSERSYATYQNPGRDASRTEGFLPEVQESLGQDDAQHYGAGGYATYSGTSPGPGVQGLEDPNSFSRR